MDRRDRSTFIVRRASYLGPTGLPGSAGEVCARGSCRYRAGEKTHDRRQGQGICRYSLVGITPEVCRRDESSDAVLCDARISPPDRPGGRFDREKLSEETLEGGVDRTRLGFGGNRA